MVANSELIKLAEEFLDEVSGESDKDSVRDRMDAVMKDLYPFVADNSLEQHPSHFDVTIELMTEPYYLAENVSSLTPEKFDLLLKKAVRLLKLNFPNVKVSIKDTTHSVLNNENMTIMAVTCRIPRKNVN